LEEGLPQAENEELWEGVSERGVEELEGSDGGRKLAMEEEVDRSVCVSLSLSLSLSLFLSVCLSVCLSFSVYVCLLLCLC